MAVATSTAIIIGALVAGGAAAYSANEAKKSSKDAADTMSETNIEGMDKQLKAIQEATEKGLMSVEEGYDKAIAILMPEDGFTAIDDYKRLLNDPDAIMDRPSTQYAYGLGNEALQAMMSTSTGGGLSGPGIKAAIEYGQNFAAGMLDLELNRLSPLIQNQTNVANLEASKGNSMANIQIGEGSQNANIWNEGLNRQSDIYGADIINQGNITSSMISSLGNTTSDALILSSLFNQPKTTPNQTTNNTAANIFGNNPGV